MGPQITSSDTRGVSPALLAAVEERYDLGRTELVGHLEGGYANDVLLVETADAFARTPCEAPTGLGRERRVGAPARLVSSLAQRLEEVHAPISLSDGETFFLHEGRPVWLMPHAPGPVAKVGDARHAAAALGRIHATRLGIEERPDHARLRDLPFPQVGQFPDGFDRARLERARDEAIKLVRGLGPLTSGITHGDFFPGNVLVEGGRVTAVLDWEEADVDWLVWDLACGLWTFCERDDRLDTRAAADFLAAYRDAGGCVPPAEDELIVPLIRVKRVLELLRAPSDRDPRWDYPLHNLRALENLG